MKLLPVLGLAALVVAGAVGAWVMASGLAPQESQAGPASGLPPGYVSGAGVANFSEAESLVPAPEIHFDGSDGQALTLAAFEGKQLVVNFWATWCAPCREEMPSLARLAQAGIPDLVILPISIDRLPNDKVAAFLAEIGAGALPAYQDRSGESARALGARGLPMTVVIDGQGRLRGTLVGPAEWDGPAATALLARLR